MTGRIRPAEKAESMLKMWWFTHSGDGHGKVSAGTCLSHSKADRATARAGETTGDERMSLTGDYAKRASKTYKTVEGRQLLSAVREFLRLLDIEMKAPSSNERGQRIGELATALEIATDVYDLFGEKDRRAARGMIYWKP